NGAVATEGRILRPQFDSLFVALASESKIDLVLITRHRIHPASGDALPSVRVAELSQGATQSLVRLIARDRGLTLSANDVESVALYSRGYPPAIMFAMTEAQTYGVPHVIANQHAVVNFSTQIFLKQLTDDRKISPKMGAVLQLLANYSPLPLS